MAILFPSIAPTNYTFTPADYPVASPKFRSTTVAPRLWGSKPNSPELSFSFSNLTDLQLLSILTAWKNSISGVIEVTLPTILTASVKSPSFRTRVRSNSWYFKGAPKLNKTSAAANTVTVDFSAHGPSTAIGYPYTTELILNYEGSDYSNTFIDSSPRNRTIVAPNNEVIRTYTAKFGLSSGSFPGPPSAPSGLNCGYLNLEGKDWTFETFWLRPLVYYSGYKAFFTLTNGSNIFGLFLNDDGVSRYCFALEAWPGFSYITGGEVSRIGTPGTWIHVAMTKVGNTSKIWIEGQLYETGTWNPYRTQPLEGNLIIGNRLGTGSNYDFGPLDCTRFLLGTAIYTAPFTPPTRPF